MLNRETIREHLCSCIAATDLSFLSDRYEGKVRDSYRWNDLRILVTTDRISCFDRVVALVPFKGQVLTRLAEYWFAETAHIVKNHLVAVPDPNVLVGREVEIVPIEVVVRGYLAGSAWRDYQAGKTISGVTLPSGMNQFQKLEQNLVTPSTKAEKGEHDAPISEQDLVERGLVSGERWSEIREKALALFAFGQKRAQERGLLLADTKYEFGFIGDELVLADEIHTLDSSRFWVQDTYEQLLRDGSAPQMLDKEPVRQWLLERGFKGDGPIPHFEDEHLVDISLHYLDSYSRITGQVCPIDLEPPLLRLERSLRKFQSEYSLNSAVGA